VIHYSSFHLRQRKQPGRRIKTKTILYTCKYVNYNVSIIYIMMTSLSLSTRVSSRSLADWLWGIVIVDERNVRIRWWWQSDNDYTATDSLWFSCRLHRSIEQWCTASVLMVWHDGDLFRFYWVACPSNILFVHRAWKDHNCPWPCKSLGKWTNEPHWTIYARIAWRFER